MEVSISSNTVGAPRANHLKVTQEKLITYDLKLRRSTEECKQKSKIETMVAVGR